MTDWAEIISRHGMPAWRSAYRLLGNEEDAADCLQDAFLAAVRIARRERVEYWPGLLRKLVTVYGLRRLRQRYRDRERHDPAAAPDAMPSREDSPDRRAEDREALEQLKAAVAILPQRQAQAFCLHYLEGLSHDQVAESLGLRVGHVGVLLHRARQRLKQDLSPSVEQTQGLPYGGNRP